MEARVNEINNHGHPKDSHLNDRARAVGVVYEFPKPGAHETEDDRRKRLRRNQRREGYVKLLEICHHLH